MRGRGDSQKVLDAEVERWSSMTCERLIIELQNVRAYEVELDFKKYQVEVQLLENTKAYIHVMVDVDSVALPTSICPLTQTFILRKDISDA